MLYSKTHQWFDEATKKVGLTAYAAEQLGEISFVDVEGIDGATLSQGNADADPIDCTVESSKAVGDVYSPVSGTVTAVNSDLMDEPELINANAEDLEKAWLFQIDASNLDAEKANLMDKAAYDAYTSSL
jgi:glycine cleavage system H protein